MSQRINAHFQDNEPLLESLLRLIRFKIIAKHIPPKSRVLDLGCGYEGALLRKLSGKIRQGVGYDFTVSSKLLPTNIVLKSGRVDQHLPIQKDSFDLVIAVAVIEHVVHPKLLLGEIYRVLKPGGKLLLTTPSKKAEPLLNLLAFQLKLISEKEIKDHKRYYSKELLLKKFIEAGFSSKNIELTNFEFGFNIFAKATK